MKNLVTTVATYASWMSSTAEEVQAGLVADATATSRK
jgi:hypothetical protein